ncbi:SpoIID/LytB domain-containing protein [Promicromonospora umidemergens]|uniref:SpoIID/LytB domain-containing protein n=1 Tax=Promicromonospora umidemergens TaxID=629679 RepID=UPI0020A2B7C6|nr:SpoIID/LytB domain-containing protein [Promicromonospora umidemergens]
MSLLISVTSREHLAIRALLARTAASALAVFLAMGIFSAPAAATPAATSAAAGYTLTASGTSTTTAAVAKRLSVVYRYDGAPRANATVSLQRFSDGSWVRDRTVTTGSTGKATASVSPTMTTKYRFKTTRATSANLTVTVVPGSWTIAGSGSGHGVGMSQYGAYQMARTGSTASDILRHYYPGATVSTANNPWTSIDVQVLGGSTDPATTTLSLSAGSWRLLDGAESQLATGTSARKISIARTAAGVTAKITENGAVRRTIGARPTLYLEWTGTDYWAGTAGTVRVSGAQGSYRHGRLRVTDLNARPNVVSQVVINDEYLYGLEEMPSLWGTSAYGGAAALEAQAIIARNYAILDKTEGLKASCDCHLYDDTRSQNYTGWKKEGGEAGGTWRAAVDATRQDGASTVSVVRNASDGIAETPYFASSGRGGAFSGTANNQDAFGTAPQSHLAHVADPYSAQAPGNPNVSWSGTLTQATAKSVFRLGWVKSVKVTARYSSGQVKTMRAVTPQGTTRTLTKTAEGWRTALGFQGSWMGTVTATR